KRVMPQKVRKRRVNLALKRTIMTAVSDDMLLWLSNSTLVFLFVTSYFKLFVLCRLFQIRVGRFASSQYLWLRHGKYICHNFYVRQTVSQINTKTNEKKTLLMKYSKECCALWLFEIVLLVCAYVV